MEKNKRHQQPIYLQAGYFRKDFYDDYTSLELTSSTNWGHNCTYQLLPNGLTGEHKFIQLHTMQISYGIRPGGMMNDIYSASDCISIAVMQKVADKACFDRMKLKVDDIFIFDDSQAFNFMSNDAIEFAVISVKKSALGTTLLPLFLDACNHRVKDTQQHFSSLLEKLWIDISEKNTHDSFEVIEESILSRIEDLLKSQNLIVSKLTKGEEIALIIRDQLYHHMDGKVSISSLSKQHAVSEKTLQNSFKSLFGFTPKLFLRQLKLNLVHHDLVNSSSNYTTVSRIAQKWGFTHMGRFSQYYTILFGENPSVTLNKPKPPIHNISPSCVLTQEEMY